VPEVLMYARPGCGLCDEAREVIMAVRARTPFEYLEVDVTGDDALELEYGIRIPVVLVDGRELFEIRVDAGRLGEAVLTECIREERSRMHYHPPP
jgi:hypothetical protein